MNLRALSGAFLALGALSQAHAQRSTNVEVTNDGDNPVPVEGELTIDQSLGPLLTDNSIRKVNVTCENGSVLLDSKASLICYQGPEGTRFFSIPAGQSLVLTDFTIVPNTLGGSGRFRVLIGRDDNTSTLPVRPRIEISGRFDATPTHFSFSSAPVVLGPGFLPAVLSGGSSGLDFPPAIGAYAYGYLIPTEDVGRD